MNKPVGYVERTVQWQGQEWIKLWRTPGFVAKPEPLYHSTPLVAAAPDLLEALKATRRELMHWIAWKDGRAAHPQREKGCQAVKIARAAIEKATQEDGDE